MSELDFQTMFASHLRAHGYEVYLEVPFLCRSIDVVAIKNGKTCTYELKLHDWRKALQQATDHQHGADESYICMPKLARLNDEMVEEAQSCGIGIVFYDYSGDTIEEALPAQEPEYSWPPAKKWLITAVGTAVARQW